MISPLRNLKKPPGLKKLPSLFKQDKLPPLPDLDAGPDPFGGPSDDELGRLTLVLGDRKLAQRILKLKEKFPDGTFPELVAMEFLNRRNVKYEFQKWLLGGRALRGGQVVDFALDMGTHTLIWEVQGNYWHTRPGKPQLDEAQKLALLGLSVYGKKVKGVVALWESRLMSKYKRKGVLEMGLSGIELGQ